MTTNYGYTRCHCRWVDAADHDALVLIHVSTDALVDTIVTVATWEDCEPEGRVSPSEYGNFAHAHGWLPESTPGRALIGLSDLHTAEVRARIARGEALLEAEILDFLRRLPDEGNG